jgi:fructoselysine 6-kinase
MSARLLTVGDNVVDRYIDLGFMYPGGNAVNVAVHARRVGADAAYLGVLGTDTAGDAVRDALQAEDVDLGLVRVVDGPNASADITVVDGNRVFGVGRQGVSQVVLSPADLEAAGSYDIVHTGECSSLESQLGALRQAVPRLSFDFSERPWEYLEAYAPHATIAIASSPGGDRAEAAAKARAIRALGPDTVAVTLGAAGALLLLDDQLFQSPAGDVAVVDTLGAGDAFIARLLYGLMTGEPAQDLLSASTTYASVTCSSHGAFGYQTPLEVIDHSAVPATTARWESR